MKKNVVTLTACFCLAALIIGVFAGCTSKKQLAETGAKARADYMAYAEKVESHEWSSDGLDWRFAIPEGYLSADIAAKGKNYVSAVNPFDTPERWFQLSTADDKRAASEIHDKYIDLAATEELALYCMNYNLFAELFVYGTYNDGIDAIYDRFNAMRALYEREDCAEALLRLFEAYDFDYQSSRDGYAPLRFTYLQVMIFRLVREDALTAEQSRRFARLCFEKTEALISSGDGTFAPYQCIYFGVVSLNSSDSKFASMIEACDAASRYIADGDIATAETISDEELGRFIIYIRKFMAD